jgi:hopanoid biosynthesis associated protein HpnK
MTKFLIVTADDFGLHPAVNEAVELASRLGVLSATSLMMGADATADAVHRARRLPQLRVGLHLVLADGLATLAPELIPGLVDARGYLGDRMFIDAVRFAASPRLRRQLEAEIRAQFAAFARTGLVLDHVNVHKHFHLHPVLLGLILRVGREFGVAALRIPDEPLWAAAQGPSLAAVGGALLLKPWLALMRRRVRAAGLMANDAVFGVASSGMMNESVLLEIIGRLTNGVTEIYLHPATQPGWMIAPSMSGYDHMKELAALMSPRVRDAIAASQSLCGGYADVPPEWRRHALRRDN